MSDLIAIAYPDEATAREVRDKLVEFQRGHSIELEDVVVFTRGDDGIQDDFLRELDQELVPGRAATVVLVRKMTPDKVLPEISGYGGDILQISLNDEGERRLQEALDRGTSLAGASA